MEYLTVAKAIQQLASDRLLEAAHGSMLLSFLRSKLELLYD